MEKQISFLDCLVISSLHLVCADRELCKPLPSSQVAAAWVHHTDGFLKPCLPVSHRWISIRVSGVPTIPLSTPRLPLREGPGLQSQHLPSSGWVGGCRKRRRKRRRREKGIREEDVPPSLYRLQDVRIFGLAGRRVLVMKLITRTSARFTCVEGRGAPVQTASP